jgi:hypothetical protein
MNIGWAGWAGLPGEDPRDVHALPAGLHFALSKIVDLCNGTGNKNEQVVKMKDDIIKHCRDHKFCRSQRLHVKQIGPHPSNRDGEGLDPYRAQTRVRVIKKGGMSFETIRPNCVAFEDNPMTKHVEKFTLLLCARSNKFAKYEKDMVKVGSVGAGHATHGFAQLHDEVECDIPEISESGKMSKNLCYEDPGIKDSGFVQFVLFAKFSWEVLIIGLAPPQRGKPI